MSTPGVSLFQGAESLQINNSADRAEEEEALEDQRRRDKEINNMLQNAFDDLEEDETTMDSTTNIDLEPIYDEYHNNNNNKEVVGFDAEMHRLNMLIAARTNEMEHFKEAANEERKKREELEKRLSITEAELDRALLTKNNTHELLVESKAKCSNLENTIIKIRNEKKALEAEHNTLLGQLETTQTMLGDVQRKYDMVERDLNKQNARTEELRRKQLEDRHRAELEMMQQQMDSLHDRLDKKQIELEHINTRYHALQSSHEKMLVEKSSRINELTGALNEAQQKCEQLLSKGDYFEENVRLQKLVVRLQDEISTLGATVAKLKERLDMTTSELNIMDKLLQQFNESSKEISPDKASTPLSSLERVGNLKNELNRALNNIKFKSEEVRKLQNIINEKNGEIEELRKEENKALVQLNTLKEENIKLEHRLQLLKQELHNKPIENEINQQLEVQLSNMQVDLEELRQEHESLKREHDELQKRHAMADKWRVDLVRCKVLLDQAKVECKRFEKINIELSLANEALKCELNNLQKLDDNNKELKIEREKITILQKNLEFAEIKNLELNKMLEERKANFEMEIAELKKNLRKLEMEKESCVKCSEHVREITKYEIEHKKLTNETNVNEKKIEELTQQISVAQSSIKALREQLKLSEQQEQLITELKTKADEFEKYIRTSQSSSSQDVSSNSSSHIKDKNNQEEEKILVRVRNEISQIYADDVKRFQIKLHEAQDRLHCQQKAYENVYLQLKQRNTEVDLLKQAILAERDSVRELLKAKEMECLEAISKQNSTLQHCRNELKLKTEKLNEVLVELKERQVQIEAERQSMKAVMLQWETQRQEVEIIEAEWKAKLQVFKKDHEEAIKCWQKKYNSAKRTAANYKRYSEDKEAHMLKEYARIKSEYDASLEKIERHMKDVLDQKNHQLQNALKSLERNNIKECNKENRAEN